MEPYEATNWALSRIESVSAPRNELSGALDHVAGAIRQDHAEENLRERRPEELTRDEVECACGQWYPKDGGMCCLVCGTVTCGVCLEPATDPVTGKYQSLVCPSCRERIAGIAKAEAVLAHRDEIVASVNLALARLLSLGQLPAGTWPDIVTRVCGQLHTLRDIYLRKAG